MDGLTETSAGRLSLGKDGLRPCTPTGCVMLAEDTLGDLTGKNVVIIGRSILVGKPAALLFLSLIHISEPTRPERISYAVFCLKKTAQ